jgi:hypothetical protein
VRKWVHALSPAATATSRKTVPTASTFEGPAAASEPQESFAGLEAELAEAEFDVPQHTNATDPLDILEARPSRAAEEDIVRQAADEIRRVLQEGVAERHASAVPVVAPASGSGGFDVVEKVDTSPGRAAVLKGDEASPRAVEGEAPVEAAPSVAPPPAPLPPTPALTDEHEDQLCQVAEDLNAAARLAALRVLRTRLERPRVRALADKLQGELKGPAERAVPAAGALGELRDGQSVPALIEALGGPAALAQTAARALLEIAQQDFGQSRKKWQAWWQTHKKGERVDWLLEGLSHKSPEIRFTSSEELRLVTGEYFGYHFDLPKKEREEARERWATWWRNEGRARLLDRR